MEDHKEYLLGELKQCDQKLHKLNVIQLSLVKFYFATVFTLSTIIIALINYKIYDNTDNLLTWFILLPLLLFGFVIWFSLKKILIQYEYYESFRNEIGDMFLKMGSIKYKHQLFNSPFIYLYSLISWLFIINLFAFLYKAIPFFGNTNVFTFVVVVLATLFAVIIFSLATVALNNARKMARDAKRKADIMQIMTASELYYADNNKYPIAQSMKSLAKELSEYIENLPVDPLNDRNFKYCYQGDDGEDYLITFQLESGGKQKATREGMESFSK